MTCAPTWDNFDTFDEQHQFFILKIQCQGEYTRFTSTRLTDTRLARIFSWSRQLCIHYHHHYRKSRYKCWLYVLIVYQCLISGVSACIVKAKFGSYVFYHWQFKGYHRKNNRQLWLIPCNRIQHRSGFWCGLPLGNPVTLRSRHYPIEYSWTSFDASRLTYYTLKPRKNYRHFTDDIFKYFYLSENVWTSRKISLKLILKVRFNNTPALVLVMVWFLPGDKPLSEPTMVILLTHKFATRP